MKRFDESVRGSKLPVQGEIHGQNMANAGRGFGPGRIGGGRGMGRGFGYGRRTGLCRFDQPER
jgi:hypothetical protein